MIARRSKSGKAALLLSALTLAVLTLTGCGTGESQAAPEVREQLAGREANVAARESQVASREATLLEREAQLTDRAAALEEREQELANRESELAAREKELGRREARVATREATVRGNEARLAEREASLEARQQEIRREANQAETRRTEEQRPAEAARREPPVVYVDAEVPVGALIDVQFLDAVSSGTSRVGENFRVALSDDLYADGDLLVAAAGTEVVGTVVEVKPAKKIGGRASLGLRFDEMRLPSGEAVPMRASLYQEGRGSSGKDAATIGGAVLGGAILGRILDDDDRGRGTVLGAIVGAAAGTAIASREPGEEVTVASGMVVTLRLDEPLMVRVPWKSRHTPS